MYKPRLLLVEDQVDLRELFGLHLTAAGYEVESAADGLQGLDKARTNPPDIMVVDMAIPGLDGSELCQRLRADPAFPVIPILIYSGFPPTDPRVVVAMQLPRVSYEPKGTLRNLSAVIGGLLRKGDETKKLMHATGGQ